VLPVGVYFIDLAFCRTVLHAAKVGWKFMVAEQYVKWGCLDSMLNEVTCKSKK
jgi:hypothetical protein